MHGSFFFGEKYLHALNHGVCPSCMPSWQCISQFEVESFNVSRVVQLSVVHWSGEFLREPNALDITRCEKSLLNAVSQAALVFSTAWLGNGINAQRV